MAAQGESWNLLNLDLTTSTAKKIAGPFTDPVAMAVDPGHTFLAVVATVNGVAAIWRVDVESGKVSQQRQASPESLSISADGRWLLTVDRASKWGNINRRALN
jgi:hypothetical protein